MTDEYEGMKKHVKTLTDKQLNEQMETHREIMFNWIDKIAELRDLIAERESIIDCFKCEIYERKQRLNNYI